MTPSPSQKSLLHCWLERAATVLITSQAARKPSKLAHLRLALGMRDATADSRGKGDFKSCPEEPPALW